MMKAARSMCGCTLPSLARLPIERTHRCAVRPVEALAVPPPQDRAVVAFPDGQVDCPGGAGNERHGGGLVALAHDPQRAMASATTIEDLGFEREASLTRRPFNPSNTATAAWPRSYCSAVNRNTPSSERSSPRASDAWTWGRLTYWAGLARMRPSMCANR